MTTNTHQSLGNRLNNGLTNPENINKVGASAAIQDLVQRQQPGCSLEQRFYQDENIFQREMKTVVNQEWLLVDHTSRIPNRGDYFLFEIANESIIIVRGENDEIRAFYNLCRHRGAPVCAETKGCKKLFVCPYHGWSYDLEGSLRGARDMPEGFDREEHGLISCHIKIFEGLIFINLDKNPPPDFDSAYRAFHPFLKLHGVNQAKIAHNVLWHVESNWKLLFENFGECYHCAKVHPEFCKLYKPDTLAAFGGGPASAEASQELHEQLAAWTKKVEDLGHHSPAIECNENSRHFAYAARAPFDFGAQSLSSDGKPVAPLMGEFVEFDGAMSVIAFNPFSCMLGFNDYAILMRFTPRTATTSDVAITWLVDRDAQEDKDFHVEKVSEVGLAVMTADVQLTDMQQKGVSSSRYVAGLYSNQERLISSFVAWYLKRFQKDEGEMA